MKKMLLILAFLMACQSLHTRSVKRNLTSNCLTIKDLRLESRQAKYVLNRIGFDDERRAKQSKKPCVVVDKYVNFKVVTCLFLFDNHRGPSRFVIKDDMTSIHELHLSTYMLRHDSVDNIISSGVLDSMAFMQNLQALDEFRVYLRKEARVYKR